MPCWLVCRAACRLTAGTVQTAELRALETALGKACYAKLEADEAMVAVKEQRIATREYDSAVSAFHNCKKELELLEKNSKHDNHKQSAGREAGETLCYMRCHNAAAPMFTW